ncbi:MAG: hypothetical protein R6V07_17570 [Armatimonadota bacterium]
MSADVEHLRAVWESLSYEDLVEAFGHRIFARGESYQHSGLVVSVAQPCADVVVGQVSGTWEYATVVRLTTGSGGAYLSSHCTCPYEFDCKHGVALVLELQEQLDANRPPSDQIPAKVRELLTLNGQEVPGESGPLSQEVRDYIDGLSREELTEVVLEAARNSASLRSELLLRARLSLKTADELKSSVISDIEKLEQNDLAASAEMGAYLRRLIELDEVQFVVDNALRIAESLNEAIEIDDWGDPRPETIPAGAIDCLDAVGAAIAASSLPPLEKLLMAERLGEADFYGLIDYEFSVDDFDEDECGAMADAIVEYIGATPDVPLTADGPSGDEAWLRSRLVHCAIEALDRIGAVEEATDLAVREAAAAGTWKQAVDRLMKADRLEQARIMLNTVVENTQTLPPSLSERIRALLGEIASREGDYARVVALAAESFLAAPSLARYQAVKSASEGTGDWQQIRSFLLKALKTRKVSDGDWPLPHPDGGGLVGRVLTPEAAARVGLDIAIDERDPDAVIWWYHELANVGDWGDPFVAERVADAIADSRPDKAIAIWRDLVESAIEAKNRSAYEQALPSLKKMRQTLVDAGREEEWKSYLTCLRDEYSRRWAFIETISTLK